MCAAYMDVTWRNCSWEFSTVVIECRSLEAQCYGVVAMAGIQPTRSLDFIFEISINAVCMRFMPRL